MKVPFLDLTQLHEPLQQQFLAEFQKVLEQNAYVLGPWVTRFEEAWAQYVGSRTCIAAQSGTSALLAALKALGIGPGDEVITAANTFVATVNAIAHTGATPILVDVDEAHLLMTAETVSKALTPQTKAIIPVHLYGQCVDMDPILALAAARGIAVIEDACQAHGATYGTRMAGSMGEIGCYSFYPGKNLGALGEGGACVTNDDALAAAMARYRNHGGIAKYEHLEPALNLRMEGLQGAALAIKLPHLDGWNEQRRQAAATYAAALADAPLQLPSARPGNTHVYHLYVVRGPRRDDLLDDLNQHHIGCGIHYPQPVHLLPAFTSLGYEQGAFPVAEAAAQTMISLPMFPGITKAQIAYVAERILQFYKA